MEQGSHRELLEMDGIFAAMWSDQISADDPNGIAYPERNGKKEVSGYDAEGSIGGGKVQQQQEQQDEQAQEQERDVKQQQSGQSVIPEAENVVEVVTSGGEGGESRTGTAPVQEDAPAPAGEPAPPELQTEARQQTEEDTNSHGVGAVSKSETDAPVVIAAPVPISPSNVPIAFPTSDEPEPELVSGRGSSSEAPLQSQSPTPGVTFDAGVQFPPSSAAGSRSETPDPGVEGKRKRTASQNFQRFARRVSLVARRTGSATSIPVPTKKEGKDDQSPRSLSKEGSSLRGVEGIVGSSSSPASSIRGSEDGRKGVNVKEKEKKKRFSISK